MDLNFQPDIFDITFELLSANIGALSYDQQGSQGTFKMISLTLPTSLTTQSIEIENTFIRYVKSKIVEESSMEVKVFRLKF